MSISAPLLIAVDGGGTGCRAAIGTQRDGILGRATGGRANIGNDPDRALANLRGVVEAAAAQAGLPLTALKDATAFIGLAGMNIARDEARLRALRRTGLGNVRQFGPRDGAFEAQVII